MKKLLIILSIILSISISFAETLIGDVSYVSDGDTIHIVVDNHKYRVRFYGIDTPEKTQEYGLEAKEFVYKRIANKEVRVEVTDVDRYGRKIGKIYYDGDKYLNEEVVKNGYAWWYEYYAKKDYDLKEAQEYARFNKLGLWKPDNPQAPWDYRKDKKNKVAPKNILSDSLDTVVYVTKSGKKYHKAGCRYLKSVYASYPLKEAEALGYEECSEFKRN